MTHTQIDVQQLVRRIRERTGIVEALDAQRVARAVSSVLLEQLAWQDRAWLAHALPEAWSQGLLEPSYLPFSADALEDFYARVAAREAVDEGFAREHAQSVCRALAEVLDDDARHKLASRLPDAIAALLVVAEPAGAPSAREHAPAQLRRRSLAEGAPGSAHPLSESAPRRAHSESVVCSDNPHGESKLSSSPGMTQERDSESLARGRPKS
jgi:uncharacterized protein (DUF2267 family)